MSMQENLTSVADSSLIKYEPAARFHSPVAVNLFDIGLLMLIPGISTKWREIRIPKESPTRQN
jgi:hypothetical protein